MAIINAQGSTLEVDNTTPGTADEAVGKIKSFSGFDGEAAEIDKTHLGSTAKEFDIGLQDFGSFTVNWQVDFADTGQDVIRAAASSAATKTFKLTLPDGTEADFSGVVKNADKMDGGVDGIVEGGAVIKISGAVTFT